METHPAARIMPPMSDDDYEALRADVEASGLLTPIQLLDGEIIDGVHRARVCKELGIEPTYREVELWEDQTAQQYVVSLNLSRRHLTASQKAAIAVEMLPALETQAEERQRESQAKPGQKVGGKVPEEIPGPIEFEETTKNTGEKSENGEAREKAGEAVGVNARYVSDAKKIKGANPEVFHRIKSGEMSLAEAKRAIKKPKAAQQPVESGTEVATRRAKMAIRTHLSPLVRITDEIAKALGLKGPNCEKAERAQNDMLEAFKAMAKGEP